MPVPGEHLPPHRVGPTRELPQGDADDATVIALRGRPGNELPVLRVDANRVWERLDGLVEMERDLAWALLDALARRRRGARDRRVSERGRRSREGGDNRDEKRLPHRLGAPASGEKWPKIGAESRAV